MGIRDLWSILTPFCERKPLYELQGKTVAVDLSCWICEAQNIAEYQIQPRMYLRNLYFRTCYLLLMDVNPIFVLEGKAPTLKYDTIAARNAIQFKGAAPKKDTIKTGKDRSRFHYTLRQCEEMLKYMGLACITGKGEAEAMCAYLNEDDLVSGCISQDSDCFAYGAKVVYRNFSISQQGAHAGSGGSVDIYDIRKAKEAIDFGRNKVIALALLVGSDYNDGVMGVGKDSAIKLFDKVSDEEILDRLRSWKNNNSLYNEFYQKVSNKNLCTSCGHVGRIQTHGKSGCKECKTTKGCDFSRFRDQRLEIKNELNMRGKALADSGFPNEELINEFLERKDNVSELNLKWKQPDLIKFMQFTTKYITWEEIYAFEKFLPILTRWQLIHIEECKAKNSTGKVTLKPDYIKKVRNPKGVPSYEIIWKSEDANIEDLIPEEQLVNIDEIKLWSTIEPQHLVEKAYPDIVETFKQSKIKPKKGATKRKNKNAVKEIEEMMANTSITEPKPKKGRVRKTKAENKKTNKPESQMDDLESSFGEMKIYTEKQSAKPKTIDSYFKKAVLNVMKSKEEENDNIRDCSSPNCSFNSDASNFGDESDLDLSDIIDDITNRDALRHIRHELNLAIDCKSKQIDPTEAGEKQGKKCDLEINNLNESSFFFSKYNDDDLFERTFNDNKLSNVSSSNSSSDTEEYDFKEYDIEKIISKYME